MRNPFKQVRNKIGWRIISEKYFNSDKKTHRKKVRQFIYFDKLSKQFNR